MRDQDHFISQLHMQALKSCCEPKEGPHKSASRSHKTVESVSEQPSQTLGHHRLKYCISAFKIHRGLHRNAGKHSDEQGCASTSGKQSCDWWSCVNMHRTLPWMGRFWPAILHVASQPERLQTHAFNGPLRQLEQGAQDQTFLLLDHDLNETA